MKTIFLLTIIYSSFLFNVRNFRLNTQSYNETTEKSIIKEKAFQVLTNKCNVCHKIQNKKKVFTKENMNVMAPKIYKQVFIKKRMPRGKKIKLTTEEYNTLENWLITLDLKQ